MRNDELPDPGSELDKAVPSFSIQNSAVILHSIRLRGAWSVTPAGTNSRHARRFGWPTALDHRERVWLIYTSLSGPAILLVNGTRVGEWPPPEHPFAADVTPLLLPRNELVIEVPTGASLGEVALQVRPADSAPAGTGPRPGDAPG